MRDVLVGLMEVVVVMLGLRVVEVGEPVGVVVRVVAMVMVVFVL